MASANGGNKALAQRLQGNAVKSNRKPDPLKLILESPDVKKRIEDILDKRAPQFMSSIINLVKSDTNLQKCDPMSVVGSCMVAATLDLPIDKNLGYAWVIPYGNRAQFQLGYKGYIQLALRSGQYKYINAIEVYEGELVSFNRLTEEIVLDFDGRRSNKVIGYAAYFELLNGFKKTVYWSREQVEAHRDRFSKQPNGKVWREDFDAMALKTVLKNMLSKWGILSIEMQQAFRDDEQGFTLPEDGDAPEQIIDISVEEVTAAEETAATEEPGGEQSEISFDS